MRTYLILYSCIFTLLLASSPAQAISACEHEFVTTQTHISERKQELIKKLYLLGAFKIGSFTFKSGMLSPSYFDMRLIISDPTLLRALADELSMLLATMQPDLLCGVPYAAVPLATALSLRSNIPMIMPRKEVKAHGTKQAIEGTFKPNNTCVIIEDVIVSGSSIQEIIPILEKSGLVVKDIIVLVDRAQGGCHILKKKGYHVHALFTLSEIINVLLSAGYITHQQHAAIAEFAAHNQVDQ